MYIWYEFDPMNLTIIVSDQYYKDTIQISREEFLKWLNVEECQPTTKDLFKSP